MRISDWSSVVCSSHLCAPSSWPPIYGRLSSSPSWQTSLQLSSWPCDGSSSVGLTGTAAQLKPSRESDPRQTADASGGPDKSEERSAGKECSRRWRTRWTRYTIKELYKDKTQLF